MIVLNGQDFKDFDTDEMFSLWQTLWFFNFVNMFLIIFLNIAINFFINELKIYVSIAITYMFFFFILGLGGSNR